MLSNLNEGWLIDQGLREHYVAVKSTVLRRLFDTERDDYI